MNKTILVTGATGNAGYTALQCLLKQFKVRAGSFNKSAKRDLVRSLAGLDSVYEYDADIVDECMDSSFAGSDYVYIIPSRSRNRIQHVRNYVSLAQKHQLKFILFFSMLRPSNSGSAYGRAYEEMESIVEDSGIPYSIIRNTIQQQVLFLFQPDIAKGVLPLPLGKGVVAPVNVCDISCLACKIFENPFVHVKKAYHLTGPELLDGFKIADIASRALGKPIRYANISSQTCKNLLIDSGIEEWLADEFVELFSEIANNRFTLNTTELYQSLTGKKGISLYSFFSNHKDRFLDIYRVKPIEDVSEGISDAKSTKMLPVVAQVSSKPVGISSGKAPVSIVTSSDIGPFDRSTVLNELERTRDLLSKWIYQQEGLLQALGEIIRQEDVRLRQLQNFREEVYQTLMDVGM